MKLTSLSLPILTFLLATPTLACLEIYGVLDLTDAGSEFAFALTVDNGSETCGERYGAVRIDQDGHWSLACAEGYVYAFTLDGTTAWYSNGINSWSFSQSVVNLDGGDGSYAWWDGTWFC
jgi:hypothetical protein